MLESTFRECCLKVLLGLFKYIRIYVSDSVYRPTFVQKYRPIPTMTLNFELMSPEIALIATDTGDRKLPSWSINCPVD